MIRYKDMYVEININYFSNNYWSFNVYYLPRNRHSPKYIF